MIGTEDERVRRELRESALDIFHVKAWTIAPDRDHFVVAQLRDPLDRVFKARCKIPARLSMHLATGNGRITSRSEKMDINPERNFRSKRGEIEKRPRGDGERTPRQFDMRFVGEDENSSSGHAFGYEKARVADKSFPLEPLRYAKLTVCKPRSILPRLTARPVATPYSGSVFPGIRT